MFYNNIFITLLIVITMFLKNGFGVYTKYLATNPKHWSVAFREITLRLGIISWI